jgi:hypothetical protein
VVEFSDFWMPKASPYLKRSTHFSSMYGRMTLRAVCVSYRCIHKLDLFSYFLVSLITLF